MDILVKLQRKGPNLWTYPISHCVRWIHQTNKTSLSFKNIPTNQRICLLGWSRQPPHSSPFVPSCPVKPAAQLSNSSPAHIRVPNTFVSCFQMKQWCFCSSFGTEGLFYCVIEFSTYGQQLKAFRSPFSPPPSLNDGGGGSPMRLCAHTCARAAWYSNRLMWLILEIKLTLIGCRWSCGSLAHAQRDPPRCVLLSRPPDPTQFATMALCFAFSRHPTVVGYGWRSRDFSAVR